MSLILKIAIAVAAALFIGVSATMNALFLSSLGQTPVEIALLTSVSIAADVVKAALPVVIARAIEVRAWAHCCVAGVLLTFVTALSLTSGAGFAALTRNGAVATRVAHSDTLTARQTELRDIEVSLDRLTQSRAVTVVEADIAATVVDRRWKLSKACSEFSGPSVRLFCSDVFKLRSELSVANERNRLAAERSGTRAKVEAMRAAGAGADSDPQAGAIAALFSVDRSTPRLVLPVTVAIILELGSIVLVLLLAGPTIGRWKEPMTGPEPVASAKPVTIPISSPLHGDVVGWQLKKNRTTLTTNRGGSHAR